MRADLAFDPATVRDIAGYDLTIDLPRFAYDETDTAHIAVNAPIDLNFTCGSQRAVHYHVGADNRRWRSRLRCSLRGSGLRPVGNWRRFIFA